MQESFRTLFCSTRTGIRNPQVRLSGPTHRRNFYLFEAGEFDGEEGYWAVDEDTNEEGFLSTEDDKFWTLDEETNEWHAANIAGRANKRRKGSGQCKKGLRKYKSKRRGNFRPYRRSGKAHLNEEEWYEDNEWQNDWQDSYFGKKGSWKNGSKVKGKFGKGKDQQDAYKGFYKGKGKSKSKGKGKGSSERRARSRR